MLLLTCGIRAQILRMEVKSRAFLPAAMRGGAVMGRNSATGSPRRSITMMPPSAASRTNSEVWMWSSRTEVFLMCHIVAPHHPRPHSCDCASRSARNRLKLRGLRGFGRPRPAEAIPHACGCLGSNGNFANRQDRKPWERVVSGPRRVSSVGRAAGSPRGGSSGRPENAP